MTPQQERAKELREKGLTYREIAYQMNLSYQRAYELVNDKYRLKKFKKQRSKESRKKYMETFQTKKRIEAQLALLAEMRDKIANHVLCEKMGCNIIVGSILTTKESELKQLKGEATDCHFGTCSGVGSPNCECGLTIKSLKL